MLIYVFVVLFPLLVGSFFNTKVAVGISEEESLNEKNRKKRWRWLFLAAFPMFVLVAFRGHNLGNDTNSYLKFFTKMVYTPWSDIFVVNALTSDFEPGFVVFEKLITLITSSARVYQVIYSFIYLVSVVTFANRLEKYNFSFLYFFATIGLYTFMFTGVRQCLAMCICLWSYPYIKKRKLIPFLILLLLAFSFHKSAILFIAAYFIYNKKIGWINTIIYAGFAGVSYVYIDVIQDWFNDQLDYEYGVEATGNGIIFFALITLVTVFSLFTMIYYKKKTSEFVGLFNVSVITFELWLLRLATRVAERPSYYFMFFSAAMLCYALNAPEKNEESLTYKTLAYCAFFMLFVYRLLTSQASLVPYVPFF